jgi:hypothetical protein
VVVVLTVAPVVILLFVGVVAFAEVFVIAVSVVFPLVVVDDLVMIPGVVVAVVGIIVTDVSFTASYEHWGDQGDC